MIPEINLVAGWAGILLGILAGVAIGLRFADDHWLGGYGSWPRRLLRLGHVSFFGLGFLNLVYYFTAARIGGSLDGGLGAGLWVAGPSLLIAAAAMPVVCVAAGLHKPARRWFFVPVLAALVGTLAVAGAVAGHAGGWGLAQEAL